MNLIEDELDRRYLEMKQRWKEKIMPERREYQEEEQEEQLQREL